MRIYLDNASTTKPLAAALDKANQIQLSCYGNPSSLHIMGVEAEQELKDAARQIAAVCGRPEDEIYFNSGGTEGNNTAILGTASTHARRGKHIITTAAEHSSVVEPMRVLSGKGYEITMLNLDKNGYIDMDELLSAVKNETILVSMHHINSETGTIQDINKAAEAVKAKNPALIFHADGVQAFGKLRLDLSNIDLYTVSAHKLHALKGTGALIMKKRLHISPLFFGGGQQSGMRPGTENVAGTAAFAFAASELSKSIANNQRHIGELKARLASIREDIPGIFINGDENCGFPYILNMSFTGIRAEVLLHSLESEGIFVSTGSACSSKKRHKNMLTAYGIRRERVESAIRFSFSPYNTMDEIDYCISVIKKTIPILRGKRGML